MSKLFEAVTLGGLPLGNRLVMAPMTRCRATEDGLATAMMTTYYAQRAAAGLIISEGIQPSPIGQSGMYTPGLHEMRQVESWQPVTQAVHEAGGRIVAQLMHAGRIGHPSLYPTPHDKLAPSPIAATGQVFTPQGMCDFPVPREMTAADIRQTIDDFAAAARNAVAAGFDGVEIHGGNGFLLHQFLSDHTNQRCDGYGGGIAARVRFVVEVVEAVVLAIGADRTGLRISPGNPYNDMQESDTPELYRELLSRLPALAFLHVMEAGNRPQTCAVRAQWRGPLILNPHETAESGPVSPQTARSVLDSGLADAVAFGALFIANPDLPARILTDGPYNTLDPNTLYGGGERGYTDYSPLSADQLETV